MTATLPVDEDGVRHGNLRGRTRKLKQCDLEIAADASSHQSLTRNPRLVAPLHGREVQFTESKGRSIVRDRNSMMNTNGVVTGPQAGLGGCDGPIAIGSQSEIQGAKTNASLLEEVRDWANTPAWGAFFNRYDALLRSWCRRVGLRGDVGDELCQRIWIELMQRMQTFRYNPSLGFRGWLWRMFRSRAIDLLRQRSSTQKSPFRLLGPEEWQAVVHERDFNDDDPDAVIHPTLMKLCQHAAEVQETIQARVDPQTWQAFWLVAIEECSIREAADSLGKTYTAVYTGYKRVDRMLREEGARRLAMIGGATPVHRGTGTGGEPETGG
jgi:RNA polymerase sigma-70 factor (ECF subfamily)